MTVGSDRWSFVGDLRLAGYAFLATGAAAARVVTLGRLDPKPDDDAFAYASLAGGVRHHLSASDTAFFVGLGIGLDYIQIDTRSEADNGGLAAYVEIGADLLRTHLFGGTIGARLDAPAFVLEGREPVFLNGARGGAFNDYRKWTAWTPTSTVTLSFRL